MTFVALTAALGTAQLAAQTDIVTGIEVVGNQRIEAETVRSYMLIGIGDAFDEARIDRSLKSLYSTQFFRDVSIRREANTIVVRVVENPVINQLAFEGNQSLSDTDLQVEVRLRPREIYNRSRLQADVHRVLQLYQRSGYFAATVEPKVIQQPSNRVDLVFEVTEGEVTGIRKINFVGNKSFSDGRLRRVILTKEEIWYRFFATDDTYDPDRLTADRALLRQFYLDNGFADFRVISAVAELSQNRTDFFVTFAVEEGQQYSFGGILVTTDIQGLDPHLVVPVLEMESGDPYSAKQVEDAIQALTTEVSRLGFPFVDVQARIRRDLDARRIDVTFEVDKGPRIIIERINISGNLRTVDEVIRREMRIAEGDAFNEARARRSEDRIRALGFFDEVKFQRREGSTPDQAIVDIDVEERSTGELSLSAGFSTEDLFGGQIAVSERNLLGRGQDLRASVSLSVRRQSFDISFTEPYFLDRDLSAGIDLFLTETDFSDFSAFSRRSIGFQLRSGFPLTEFVRLGLNYELRTDEITDIEANASRFILAQEGTTTSSAIGYVATLDRRDDRLQPTDGYIVRFRQNFAGVGGDVRFLRNVLEMAYYYPWEDQWVTRLAWEEGFIFGLGEQVRLSNRFFIGGNSFRGFSAGGVGPRDLATNDALGGTVYYVGTVEQSFPLGLPEELGMNGRVFTEFGSLADPDESGGGILDTGSVRVTIGFGISWRSPFGPVALDLGYAVVKEDFDDTEILRFNFGTRF